MQKWLFPFLNAEVANSLKLGPNLGGFKVSRPASCIWSLAHLPMVKGLAKLCQASFGANEFQWNGSTTVKMWIEPISKGYEKLAIERKARKAIFLASYFEQQDTGLEKDKKALPEIYVWLRIGILNRWWHRKKAKPRIFWNHFGMRGLQNLGPSSKSLKLGFKQVMELCGPAVWLIVCIKVCRWRDERSKVFNVDSIKKLSRIHWVEKR